jgi:hypothetical protein
LPSPNPQREVLRERNDQAAAVENALCKELGAESSAKLAGRQGALCMDWQDINKTANASPPAFVHSTESAGPKQAAALPEEVPIVPRDLAPEVSDISPSLNFSMTHAHPMVTPEEKTFIHTCLQALSDIVEREGGFKQYTSKDSCEVRDELTGLTQDDEESLTPQEILRRSSETTLRNTVRNGTDSVAVLLGGTYSMGMKKVVKVEVKCEETGLSQVMSIYWDWDVKLEQRSGQN